MMANLQNSRERLAQPTSLAGTAQSPEALPAVKPLRENELCREILSLFSHYYGSPSPIAKVRLQGAEGVAPSIVNIPVERPHCLRSAERYIEENLPRISDHTPEISGRSWQVLFVHDAKFGFANTSEVLAAHFKQGASNCEMTLAQYVEMLKSNAAFRELETPWILKPYYSTYHLDPQGYGHIVSGNVTTNVPGIFLRDYRTLLVAKEAIVKRFNELDLEGRTALTILSAGCGPGAAETYAWSIVAHHALAEFAALKAAGSHETGETPAEFARREIARWSIKVIGQSIEPDHLDRREDVIHSQGSAQEEDALRDLIGESLGLWEFCDRCVCDNDVVMRVRPEIEHSVRLEWNDLLDPETCSRNDEQFDVVVLRRSLYPYENLGNIAVRAAIDRMVLGLRPGAIFVTDTEFEEACSFSGPNAAMPSNRLFIAHPFLREVPVPENIRIKKALTTEELASPLATQRENLPLSEISKKLAALGYQGEIDARQGYAPSGVYVRK